MSFAWLFSAEVPLPQGHRLVVVDHATGELGRRRLREAASVLGEDAAREEARRLGRYELDEESRRTAGLAGAETGEHGEVPALSPERWASRPELASWDVLRKTLAEGEEIAGLALSRSQRESFLRFLARNHVKPDENIGAEKAVSLARHFFFQEPLVVVVRYTPPRFAHS